MLTLTSDGCVRTGDRVTRREFLQAGALGAAGLSLPQWMAAKAHGAVRTDCDDRSAIMIFNLGAPSHLDTFDPKPDAPSEIRGPFRAMRTASPEIQVTEILPRHAQHADKFSLVRSCYHTAPAVHDTGHQMMQTGRLFVGGVESPHAGCALSYLRGRRGALPPNVVLPGPMGRTGGNLPHGQNAGFLAAPHDPLVLAPNPSSRAADGLDLLSPRRIGEACLDGRRPLRRIVEQTLQDFENGQAARASDDFQAAYSVMTSPAARAALDLGREPGKLRAKYGSHRFGQCCLLARRLIEAGVRFVTINTFLTVYDEISWDIHGSKPFATIREMRDVVAPMYDQAYGALIEDLSERGMLQSTLVCSLAEFGRTPRINAAGGRDHWPECWTVSFAGGGVQGGRVVGRSDAIGAYPAERPVQPAEVVATVFHSLGLDLKTPLPSPAGGTTPLVDDGVREIEELF
jgi:hypothetical protein